MADIQNEPLERRHTGTRALALRINRIRTPPVMCYLSFSPVGPGRKMVDPLTIYKPNLPKSEMTSGNTSENNREQLICRWAPLLICLGSSLITLLVILGINFATTGVPYIESPRWPELVFAAMGAFFLVTLVVASRHQTPLSTFLQVSFLVGFITVLLNVVFKLVDLLGYGDSGYLSMLIENRIVFPRWFLGSTVLSLIYQPIALTIGSLSTGVLSPDEFVRISGAALMTASSVIGLKKFGPRLIVIMPMLTPVWLLFCSGYNEYYPFIAGLYLSVVLILNFGPAKYSPVLIASISSVALLSYTGFAPLGALLLLYYTTTTKTSKSILAIVLTGVISILLVTAIWPGTFTDLLQRYEHALNLGEQNSCVQYAGLSANTCTPFFRASYAFSGKHALELAFMLFFGGGWIPLLALLLSGAACLKYKWLYRGIDVRKTMFMAAWLAFQTFYFLFMIPKLGPIRDIDLFFTFYLLVAFVAGGAVDKICNSMSALWRDCIRYCAVGALIGSSSVILAYLLRIGFAQ